MSGGQSECEEEAKTCHHLGSAYGFGPIQDAERLVYVIFRQEEIRGGSRRVSVAAFPTKQLSRDEVSVARLQHITKEEFRSLIVAPAVSRGAQFIGAAVTIASRVRAMEYTVPNTNPKISGRAVCVIDKVTPQDFDAHGALGFSESQKGNRLNQKQKEITREQIRADLADAFGEICSLDDLFAQPGTS